MTIDILNHGCIRMSRPSSDSEEINSAHDALRYEKVPKRMAGHEGQSCLFSRLIRYMSNPSCVSEKDTSGKMNTLRSRPQEF